MCSEHSNAPERQRHPASVTPVSPPPPSVSVVPHAQRTCVKPYGFYKRSGLGGLSIVAEEVCDRHLAVARRRLERRLRLLDV
eukprot:scaffold54683_cov56-Phaeocystis_antarctica.AAC.5